MWFKQIQLFQFNDALPLPFENLGQRLEALLFTPCLPSMAWTLGWVPLLDEESSPMVRMINGCIIFCLQIEEKILPATVVRQALNDKLKKIEAAEDRKVRQKEKLALKDEIIHTLLPRAFSKFTRLYAYIDTVNKWVVLGTTHAKKTEHFLGLFKKSISEKIESFKLKKISPTITQWLKEQNPSLFAIEKACLLQDPQKENRIIRCQEQNLFAQSIQSLIKDGCEVKQLALSWQDRLRFILADDFSLRNIQFQDDIRAQSKEMEAETKQQQFDADFFIMSQTFSKMLRDLLPLFLKHREAELQVQLQ